MSRNPRQKTVVTRDAWRLRSEQLAWWRSLTWKQRAVVVYFLASFCLVMMMDDGSPLWAVFAAILNLGNAVRLIRRVPMDSL